MTIPKPSAESFLQRLRQSALSLADYYPKSGVVELLNEAAAEIDRLTTLLRAAPASVAPQEDKPMTEDQIKHMVNRFLSWKLPKSFNPDGGISYTRPNWDPRIDATPSGTNLFDATQAEAMVRYVVEGLTEPSVSRELVRLLANEEEFDRIRAKDEALINRQCLRISKLKQVLSELLVMTDDPENNADPAESTFVFAREVLAETDEHSTAMQEVAPVGRKLRNGEQWWVEDKYKTERVIDWNDRYVEWATPIAPVASHKTVAALVEALEHIKARARPHMRDETEMDAVKLVDAALALAAKDGLINGGV